MAPRRRCSECRCTFTPSPRARTKQRVCGPACRKTRDHKLARKRRRNDIDGYRDDERGRQRASRAARAAARGVDPPRDRHAPASDAKSSEVREKIARIVDRAVALSRATLVRDLSREWPRMHEILVGGVAVSRTNIRGQVPDFSG